MPCRSLILLLLLVLPYSHAEVDKAHWYTPPQEDLAYFQTQFGEVVIMLTDTVAPTHKARFTDLVNDGFYDNKYFYRVIEGFVAQAGSNNEQQTGPHTSPLAAEFMVPRSESFTLVEANAAHAPQTGFINGIPAGSDNKTRQQWLLHCPGTLAFARNNDKNSATTEFYIVLGQAPRHLDKNMSVVGKVVAGMRHLQQLPRGMRASGGVIESPTSQSQILSARMGDKLSPNERRTFQVQRASHPAYQQKVTLSRNLDNPFYNDKSLAPRVIDVCYYQTDIQELTSKPE